MEQTCGSNTFRIFAFISIIMSVAPTTALSDQPTIPSIIPRPMKLELGSGRFLIQRQTPILVASSSREASNVARHLSEQLALVCGSTPAIKRSATTQAAGSITLKLDANSKLGTEGYELSVKTDGVLLRAAKPAGLFYGVQTLRQLLPEPGSTEISIPALHIVDMPRFQWRGLLLDPARHFQSKEFLKRYIDLIAYHKLNVLHLHLTDDQGWRIEIKRYPKLTQIGAWRGEGETRHGGFYTKEEIREIVAYASSRHVNVVPEFEMPGHSTAALTAYPQFSCTGGPFRVETNWGIFKDVFCPGKDETYVFIENILREILALFPSKFIHIGGDEVPKDRWKACARCQKRIHDSHLKDEHELQSYFIRHIDKFLTRQGRRLIGWDEILEGGLAPGATVHSWRGMKGAVAAARAKHDVVASPTTHCYLDYPLKTISLEKIYSFEPIPSELTQAEAKRVLGVQGNMWGERVPTPRDVDRQVFPRLCGLAEVAWSVAETRSLGDFSARLQGHLPRLRAMGVSGE